MKGIITKLVYLVAIVAFFVTTAHAQCSYQLRLLDSFGDGWNGNTIDVKSGLTTTNYTLLNGSDTTISLTVNTGDSIVLDYLAGGNWNNEVSFQLIDANNNVVFTSIQGPAVGVAFADTAGCPSCVFPINLRDSNITASSVDLNWTDNNPATSWIVQYDTAGFTLGTGIDSIVTSRPFRINGLNPFTDYDWYVRSVCSVGDTSSWSPVASFKTLFQCPAGAACATYNTSSIPTDYDFNALPGTSNCPANLSVTIPMDNRIDSVSTFYDMTAINGAWMSEQVSWIFCPNTSAGEATASFGLGAAQGTYNYNRSGLTFANSAIGTVNFEMHAGRTWGGAGCDTLYNMVDRGTWTVIAYYSPMIQLNAKVREILNPSGALCPGTINPRVVIENDGIDTITTVDLVMDVNGVLDTVSVNRSLATKDTAHISLPSVSVSAGLSYDMSFYTINPNGQADLFQEDDTLSINNLFTGLAGAVTLDPSLPTSPLNFQSFTALASQLNTVGACGSVTVTVAPGTYNDVFLLEEIVGTDSSNRVTIDGVDSSLVTLENNFSVNNALVRFNSTDYVTVKNMTLRSTYTGTTTHFGVHFMGGAHHDSIVNCRVLLSRSTTSTAAVVIGATADEFTNFAEGNNANFVTVMNSDIIGGYYGVRFEGGGTFWNVGNAFHNNTFRAQNFYGFYLDDQDSISIVGNHISGLRNTGGDGIYCFDAMNFKFTENYILAPDYGMYVTNANSGKFADFAAEIVNNMIISTSDYGLYLTTPIWINIWHNSIYVEGSSEAIRMIGAFTDSLDFRNNVISSLTSEAMDISEPDSVTFLRFDNNVYHTGGATLFAIDGVTYVDLASYQMAQPNYNVNSLEGGPQFVSTTDLHITGGFINNTGDNFLPVDIDIDGDPRPFPFSTDVDPGADEYDPPICPPPLSFEAYSPGLDSVTIIVDGVSQNYEWEIVSSGSPQGSGFGNIILADSVRVGGLTPSTTYDLYVREVCGRGDTSIWIGPETFNTAFGVPYLENFETFPFNITSNPWPRGWSSSTSADPVWVSNYYASNVFLSGGTGPIVDHTLGTDSGMYVYMETSGGTVGAIADFISPPIYIPDTLNGIEISYWYFNHGSNIDEMNVVVLSNGIEDTIATYVGQQQSSQNEAWRQGVHPLSGYSNQSIQIIFRGVNAPCCTGDLAIDDVEVKPLLPINGGVTDIVRPVGGCGLGSADSVEVEIKNSGTNELTNFSVSYRLNGGTVVTETYSDTIQPNGGTANYVFNTTVNLATAGNYTLEAFTSITGDGEQGNDSTDTNFDNIPIFSGFPYSESFESGNGGWISGGSNSSWALGTPAALIIDTASDGTQAWVTNLTGAYNNGEVSWVESPCFDFSSLSAPQIEMDVWWNSEFSWDGAVLQASTDGGVNWQKVGDFGDPDNWYTDNSINGLAPIEISQEGWTGRNSSSNGSNGWVTAKNDLSGLGGIPGVILRVVFGSDGSVTDEGFAFDSVRIADAPPVNGAVAQIVRPTGGCGLGAADSVEVAIANVGSDTINSFSISYILNGGTVVTENFSGMILPTDTVNYLFSSTVNLSTLGSYDLEVYIDITGDVDPNNDSLQSNFENVPIFTGFPYAESFEGGNGGWTSGGVNSTWALGAPNGAVINSASHGTQAWMTNLSGAYNNNEVSWVQSPCFDFSSLAAPEIEMDVWWNSEFSWDGAVLQSSIDGGATWQKVGDFGDTNNWYTDNTINGLAAIEISQEGWSGRNSSSNGSSGWVTAKNDLSGLGGIPGVILRVVFGSDGSVTDDGFAFDSVRIAEAPLDAEMALLVEPISSVDSCYSSTEDVIVNLANAGSLPIDFSTDSAFVEVNVSGAVSSSLTTMINDNSLNGGLPLTQGNGIDVNIGSINMSTAGTYNFEAIVSIAADSSLQNDTLYTSIIISPVSGGMLSGVDSICSGDTASLMSTNYQGQLQWQYWDGSAWLDLSGETNAIADVSPTSTTDYRVVACGSVYSDTITVTALTVATPTLVNDSVIQVVNCGSSSTATGSVSNPQLGVTYKWFDSPVGGSEIANSAPYSISSNGDSISYTVTSTVINNPASSTVWVEPSINNVNCSNSRVPLYLFIDCVVGLEDKMLGESSTLSVYPNPSKGLFTLNIQTAHQERFVMTVRDVKGQLIHEAEINVNGSYRDDLNFSAYAKGVYYMHIQTEESSIVEKLIIQ